MARVWQARFCVWQENEAERGTVQLLTTDRVSTGINWHSNRRTGCSDWKERRGIFHEVVSIRTLGPACFALIYRPRELVCGHIHQRGLRAASAARL